MLTAFHAVGRSFNRARMSIVFGAGIRAPASASAGALGSPSVPAAPPARDREVVLPRPIGGSSDGESLPSADGVVERARATSSGGASFTSTASDYPAVPAEWRFKDVEKM